MWQSRTQQSCGKPDVLSCWWGICIVSSYRWKKYDMRGQTIGPRLLCMCRSSEKVCGDGLPWKSSTHLLICVVCKMLLAIIALVLPAVCPYRCFAQGGAETCGSKHTASHGNWSLALVFSVVKPSSNRTFFAKLLWGTCWQYHRAILRHLCAEAVLSSFEVGKWYFLRRALCAGCLVQWCHSQQSFSIVLLLFLREEMLLGPPISLPSPWYLLEASTALPPLQRRYIQHPYACISQGPLLSCFTLAFLPPEQPAQLRPESPPSPAVCKLGWGRPEGGRSRRCCQLCASDSATTLLTAD